MADRYEPPADALPKTNTVLAEWAARALHDNDLLIERFEGMGYEVRGKSEDEIVEVLKHPPTKGSAR